jgi:hypothetical protein
MPNLEQVGLEASWVRLEEASFGLALGVTDQQRDALAEGEAEHDGRVVGAAVGRDGRTRSQHRDLGLAVMTWRPAQLGRTTERHPTPCEPLEERAELPGAHLSAGEAALPQLSHLDLVERARQPEVVVRMRVRQHHHVDPRPSSRGELREEHSSADVGPSDLSPAVDQQELPVGEIDEQCVALTNVKKRQPELARRRSAMPRDELGGHERARGDDADAQPEPRIRLQGERRQAEDDELRGGRRRQSERRAACVGGRLGDCADDP